MQADESLPYLCAWPTDSASVCAELIQLSTVPLPASTWESVAVTLSPKSGMSTNWMPMVGRGWVPG